MPNRRTFIATVLPAVAALGLGLEVDDAARQEGSAVVTAANNRSASLRSRGPVRRRQPADTTAGEATGRG